MKSLIFFFFLIIPTSIAAKNGPTSLFFFLVFLLSMILIVSETRDVEYCRAIKIVPTIRNDGGLFGVFGGCVNLLSLPAFLFRLDNEGGFRGGDGLFFRGFGDFRSKGWAARWLVLAACLVYSSLGEGEVICASSCCALFLVREVMGGGGWWEGGVEQNCCL